MNHAGFPAIGSIVTEPGCVSAKILDANRRRASPIPIPNQQNQDFGFTIIAAHRFPFANLKRLIDGARRAGVPVLFVQATYDSVYLPPTWHERNARMNFDVPRCLRGSWGGDFHGIAPQQSDVIIRKHRFSAFVDTELDLILRSRDIKTVIATGIATNICVESTARDAFMRDYYVALVDDASAAYSSEQHDSALKNIAIGFGVIAKVDDILKSWQTYDGNC